MLKFAEKIRGNQNTHFVINNVFKNRAVYEIIWKNIVQPGRPQKKIWRMVNAYWVLKAISTSSDYAMFIAFPQQ
jgi:hypothetical protein